MVLVERPPSLVIIFERVSRARPAGITQLIIQLAHCHNSLCLGPTDHAYQCSRIEARSKLIFEIKNLISTDNTSLTLRTFRVSSHEERKTMIVIKLIIKTANPTRARRNESCLSRNSLGQCVSACRTSRSVMIVSSLSLNGMRLSQLC